MNTLIPGGEIGVKRDVNDPNTTTDHDLTMEGKGRTLSKEIPSGTYTITLKAPDKYTPRSVRTHGRGSWEPAPR